MGQFKRAKVIMLDTENENKGLYLSPVRDINILHYWDERVSNSYIAKHLYITSDDEIKEGGYYYNPLNKRILKADTDELVNNVNHISYAKKVIATTDKSLGLNEHFIDPLNNRANQRFVALPHPPAEFIQYFIEEYNRGNTIADVLVELKSSGLHFFNGDLRINPKDNTISIKPVEETWDNIAEEFNQWCTTMGKVPVTNQYQAYLVNNYQPPKKK